MTSDFACHLPEGGKFFQERGVATAFPVNIGTAAEISGVSTRMIRHYEKMGLIGKARRTYSGYRVYSEAEVHALRFIRHARDLGFRLRQLEELLGLWQNHRRASGRVKTLAVAHIACLDAKIAELAAMKRALQTLAERCHGDDRPECPILEGLAREGPPHVVTPGRRRASSSRQSPDACPEAAWQ